MEKIKSIKDLNIHGKRVLVRVDFNVPLEKSGKVSDKTRIEAALPTIRFLIDNKAKIILMSHLGRPDGEKKEEYTLQPVAKVLAEVLNHPVTFVENCIGSKVDEVVGKMQPGQVVLLENLRFYGEEEENDAGFSKKLAKLGEVYINDAFGAAHRAHASIVGVANYIQEKGMGFLMEKEVEFLKDKTENPKRPFTVILGGAKVSDKIAVIEALLEKADIMLIGGAMAYTFALAEGKKVGNSLAESDKVTMAKDCLKKAAKKGIKFLLPVDTLITDKLDFKGRSIGKTKVVEGDIPDGWEGVDVGTKTIQLFKKEVEKSGTILWNGPMGVFEIQVCAQGTYAIAESVAMSNAISIIGGGDSVKAINSSGYADKVSFISTGGGASLELLEGKELPGLESIKHFKRGNSKMMHQHIKPLIVANWKMNKTTGEALAFAEDLIKDLGKNNEVHVVVCSPYTSLAAIGPMFTNTTISLGAQNLYPETKGAFTGEISAAMLRDLFVNYVIVGHSERRTIFRESSGFINKKIIASLEASLKPILCIGETLEAREAEKTMETIAYQLMEGIENVDASEADRLVIAYEPVWAIGTGKTATSEQVHEVHSYIRKLLLKKFGKNGGRIAIIYGGSLNAENAEALLSQTDVNGALVGGASLSAKSFYDIIKIATRIAESTGVRS